MRLKSLEEKDDERQTKRNIKLHQVRPGGHCADERCSGVIRHYTHGCQCSKRCGRIHYFAAEA